MDLFRNYKCNFRRRDQNHATEQSAHCCTHHCTKMHLYTHDGAVCAFIVYAQKNEFGIDPGCFLATLLFVLSVIASTTIQFSLFLSLALARLLGFSHLANRSNNTEIEKKKEEAHVLVV